MSAAHQGSAVRAVVEVLARALTDRPDEVHVKESEHKSATLVELFVGSGELGRVIGKQGRTARSVRTILGAVSMKLHHRYTLDILEEDDEA